MKLRHMTVAAVKNLSDEERRRLLRTGWLLPISGAEDGDEDDDDDEDGDPSKKDKDDDDEDDADADVLEISRADYNSLKAAAAKARKAEAAKEAAEKKAADQKKKDAGEYEDLLAEKDARIAELETERDGVAHEFDQHKRSGLVKDAAVQFGFKDPTDAMANLTDEDTEDANSVQRALRRVARAKPYLVDPKKATGAPIGNGNGHGGLTIDQIRGMSQQEVNDRMEEVQAVLAAG